jgi:hypothetical protein
LTVIGKNLQGGGGAIAKDIDGAFERIISQALPTHGRESINTFAKVDGLGGNKDAALGAELEQQRASKKARTKSQSAGVPW